MVFFIRHILSHSLDSCNITLSKCVLVRNLDDIRWKRCLLRCVFTVAIPYIYIFKYNVECIYQKSWSSWAGIFWSVKVYGYSHYQDSSKNVNFHQITKKNLVTPPENPIPSTDVLNRRCTRCSILIVVFLCLLWKCDHLFREYVIINIKYHIDRLNWL